MNIVNKSLLALFGLVAAGAASASSFLNYKAGDKALFASYRGETELAITSESGNWRRYSSFLGQSNVWIYTNAGNENIHIRNAAGQSQLLVDLAAAKGARFPGQFGACVNQATLAEKGITLRTDDGDYANVVRVDFRNTCGHSGLTKAWFAPKVGVVRYEEINGRALPAMSTLAAAVVNGVTYPENVGLKLSVDAPAQRIVLRDGVTGQITSKLTVSNTSTKPLPLTFMSGQSADAILLNAEGEEINRWSAGKAFTQAVVFSELAAGKSMSFGLSFPATKHDGHELEIGSYTLRLKFLGRINGTLPAASLDVPVFIDRRVTLLPRPNGEVITQP